MTQVLVGSLSSAQVDMQGHLTSVSHVVASNCVRGRGSISISNYDILVPGGVGQMLSLKCLLIAPVTFRCEEAVPRWLLVPASLHHDMNILLRTRNFSCMNMSRARRRWLIG